MESTTWFSVRLLFVSSAGASDADRLCEESIVVVREADEARAGSLAERIAPTMCVDFHNELGELVRWEFVGVLEVQNLYEEAIENGTEVYSRLCFENQIKDQEMVEALRTHDARQSDA